MIKNLDNKGKFRRYPALPGYSSFTFQDLNDDKKIDVINRLKLLSDEFNDRSEIELFTSDFLSHSHVRTYLVTHSDLLAY